MFAPESEPATFIVTPEVVFSKKRSGTNDTPLQHPYQVEKIKDLLRRLIPFSNSNGPIEPRIVGYTPSRDRNDPYRTKRVSGKILFQYDPFQDLITTQKDCNPDQQPMLRLWVGASAIPAFEKTWKPLPDQSNIWKRAQLTRACGISDTPTTQVIDSLRPSVIQISTSTILVSSLPPVGEFVSSGQPSSFQEAPSMGGDSSISSYKTSYRTSTITVVPIPLSTIMKASNNLRTASMAPLSGCSLET